MRISLGSPIASADVTMSFSGDKYELTNFRAPNAGQKKLRRAVVIGGGVLAVWIGTIGVVAAKRFKAVDEGSSISAPPVAAAAAPAQAPSEAKPTAAVAAEAPIAKPTAAVAVAAAEEKETSAKAHSSTHSKASRASSRHHRSSKRYAATTSTATKPAASASGSRMKDDQLDALLKQFK